MTVVQATELALDRHTRGRGLSRIRPSARKTQRSFFRRPLPVSAPASAFTLAPPSGTTFFAGGVQVCVMGKVFCLAIVAFVAAHGTLASTGERPQRTIPCDEFVDVTRFPYPGARLVLGAVSVPRAYGRAYPRSGAWPYFAKGGIVVKSGTSITITVPPAWRKRVAISWGNNVHRVFHTIRIAACSRVYQGYAYAGGFFLRRPSACAPLVFAVGDRRKRVWFGIGRRCR